MAFNSTGRSRSLMDVIEASEGARKVRDFTPGWNLAFRLIAAGYSVFLIVSIVANMWSTSTLRATFIMLVTSMIFMRYRATSRSPLSRPSVIDLGLIVLAVLTFGNFIIDYTNMAWRGGSTTPRDIFFGVIAIGLVLEACRRAMSLIMPTLALILLLYADLGPYLPGDLFSHQGFSASRIVADTYASMNGIFGFVAYVFIAFVMLFVVMGAIFQRFGAGAFYIDLPMALTGRFRGGPAKAAVLASGFFGMISGSATANTVATGTFTIPLMKKSGYRPHVAGGIEASASTGGMFMPPVMGAGVFLMAEMLRMPYAEIMLIALVPALLYFFANISMVHFEALRSGVEATPASERKEVWPILKSGWIYLLPIFVLFGVLLSGRTASLAAVYAIATFLAAMAVRFILAGDIKGYFKTLFDALADGGDKSLIVGSTAGPVGIIVGMALLTGLAFKFSALMLSFTFGMVWVALIIIMLATFVLGLGMTVTADYLLLAVLAAPALGEMGVPLIAAHLCVFWFSQSSNVTPPVCMAAFAASSIADSHPYRTGFQSMRFSSYLYIMPFMFVYTPILMPEGFNMDVLYTWVILFFSAIPFAAGVSGYFLAPLNWPGRILLIVGAFLLMFPYTAIDLLGGSMIAAVGGYQFWQRMQSRKAASAG
ncbi:TRAP transporter permease [Oceanibacterium hippocampi]|uniref:Sialic acid TRAP transporter permease protein SiaT n=1 Tax=Oceanibacterium hippocampi TaxID=745714 RepID=A0A1Y5SJ20_9PROT|nr:TRAP transporter fused permease subunit [Oceanibacterium hippocampi]SLN41963.1 Sialic acid TRAP transporter permease protein SiaT [Oceanibacterium hippocampi]